MCKRAAVSTAGTAMLDLLPGKMRTKEEGANIRADDLSGAQVACANTNETER